jgi:hypothetical protein
VSPGTSPLSGEMSKSFDSMRLTANRESNRYPAQGLDSGVVDAARLDDVHFARFGEKGGCETGWAYRLMVF